MKHYKLKTSNIPLSSLILGSLRVADLENNALTPQPVFLQTTERVRLMPLDRVLDGTNLYAAQKNTHT